jgi:hypothetical protein
MNILKSATVHEFQTPYGPRIYSAEYFARHSEHVTLATPTPAENAFTRMMALQAAAETRNLTANECVELSTLENDWHNAALMGAHDIPVRS